jgi:hypothetical protein
LLVLVLVMRADAHCVVGACASCERQTHVLLGVVFVRLLLTWRKLKFGSGEAWSARKR